MPQHVLVAGCADQTQTVLCDLFRRVGMKVLATSASEEAISVVNNAPDLLVLDLAIDGSAKIVEAISKGNSQTRVAVVSSGREMPSHEWIPLCRPDAVFGKPLDFTEFGDWLTGVETDCLSQQAA